MTYGFLSSSHEHALRFLIAVGSATHRQIDIASIAASRSRLLSGFPLSAMMGSNYAPDDLASLGLIHREGDIYRATEQGHALIRSIDMKASGDGSQAAVEELMVVTGKPSDPHFYAQVLETLNNMDNILLVDPYLAVVDLNVIAKVGNVTRVLTGTIPVADRGEVRGDSKRRLVGLGIFAGTTPATEVRTSKRIHDRYALPSTGRGYMIGASMGSTKVTALVELSDSATRTLLAEHSEIWAEAQKVEPITAPSVPC